MLVFFVGFFVFVFITSFEYTGARCCSVVRAFAHGAMGRRIQPSWGGPIELFLVPATTGVTKAVVCVILSVG